MRVETMMQVHFELPDDFAQLLQATWHDNLAHYARERLVMEACRNGLLTKKDVGDLLGVDRFAVEALCKQYQMADYTLADFHRDGDTVYSVRIRAAIYRLTGKCCDKYAKAA